MASSNRYAHKRETSASNRSKRKPASAKSGVHRRTSGNSSDRSEKQQGKHHQRRQTRKQNEEDQDYIKDSEETPDGEASDPEEKLCAHLQSCLLDCSRQRLRALQMSLRHYGNVDNRVTFKDMQTSLQENQIKLSQRVVQMMTDLYQDVHGIDYNRLHLCMDRAHLRTGRDSVKARNKRNDLEAKQAMTVDQIDKDFLRRLEELLVRDHTFFDIDLLRTEFSNWDHHRLGKMDKEGATLICSDKSPLYGALLKNLLSRCDEDKDKKVSWPLLLNFMEKAQASAWEKHPELSTLPEKSRENKANRIATPELLDELSSSTRSKVMSKLMEKARRSPVAPKQNNEKVEKEAGNSRSPPPSEAVTQEAKNIKTEGRTVQTAEKEQTNTSAAPANTESQALEQAKQTSSTNQKRSDHHVTVSSKTNHIKTVAPKDYQAPTMTSDPPKERLQLEWIYGYHGHGQASGSRPQLVASGEMVYFIGSTVVLYNRLEHHQRHYREHSETVRCLTVHSAGMIVASGQDAGKDGQGLGKKEHNKQAHVRIWRSDTLETLHLLDRGMFENTVVAACFMPGQDLLACCDNSQDKKLTLWNTADGTLVAETFISAEVISQISFNPKWPEVLVTGGKEHLAWWKVYVDTRMIQPLAKPNYEGFLRARFINCLRHNQKGDLITGDSNGTVYVWGEGGNKITNFVKHGHEGPVLDVLQFKGHLLTSGRDGAVRCWTWDKNMDNDGELQLPDSEGGIRSLLLVPPTDDKEAELVLGTTMNSLVGVNLSGIGSPLGGALLNPVPITHGHTSDLRAICPIRRSFLGADILTASTDGVVCKLSAERREPVWRTCLKGRTFTCADCNGAGDVLALGTRDGRLLVLELNPETMSVREVFYRKVTPGAVSVVKFSPDERIVAVGTSDRCIQVFCLTEKSTVTEEDKAEKQEGEEEWILHGVLKGHVGHIQGIDWSADKHGGSYVIRTSSRNPEQKFWKVTQCEEISGDSLSDFPWSTATCLLDHKLVGLWTSRQASEGHVTCVDVNPGRTVVAMATDSGSLSLFQYPCCMDKAFSHAYRCHRHPANLCFTPDGRGLLTVGGADVSIMQWKLV